MVRRSFADSQVRRTGKAQTGEGELTALESWKSGGYQSEEGCWPEDLAHSSLGCPDSTVEGRWNWTYSAAS